MLKRWLICPTLENLPWSIGFMSGAWVGYDPSKWQFYVVFLVSASVCTVLEKWIAEAKARKTYAKQI